MKILIVEDDPMIAEIYQKKFSDAGFEVKVVSSGEQALVMAKQEVPNVILSDLMMPKMNGFEIVENIRKGNFDSNIKIIIASNMSQPEDREKALSLGANGFVCKADFTPGDLVKEVSRILGQVAEQPQKEDLSAKE